MLRPDLEEAYAKLRQMLFLLARAPIASATPRDRWKCSGFTTNAGRTRVASSTSRFEIARWDRGSSPCRTRLRSDRTSDPGLFNTLAAAYAEAGDFPRAIAAAEEALNRARSSGDNDAAKLSENILVSLRENAPYRQEPE